MEKVDLWKKYAVDFPVESFLGQVAIDLGFDENAYRQLLIDLKEERNILNSVLYSAIRSVLTIILEKRKPLLPRKLKARRLILRIWSEC